MTSPHPRPGPRPPGATGLARALSKRGFCSRREAWALILAGHVRVNGAVQRDPERRVRLDRDRLEVDGQVVGEAAKVYVMLNKPRGLVTTTADEKGRQTVYACLTPENRAPDAAGGITAADLPRVIPVGRLDQASEGLLLFTNDTAWADGITDPARGPEKTYHVQVRGQPDDACLSRMTNGVEADGERLAARHAHRLRHGDKTCWLEIVLDEGRNRHIRRMLEALGFEVLRLIRVAIGPLALGSLAKGSWRPLSPEEVRRLRQ